MKTESGKEKEFPVGSYVCIKNDSKHVIYHINERSPVERYCWLGKVAASADDLDHPINIKNLRYAVDDDWIVNGKAGIQWRAFYFKEPFEIAPSIELQFKSSECLKWNRIIIDLFIPPERRAKVKIAMCEALGIPIKPEEDE